MRNGLRLRTGGVRVALVALAMASAPVVAPAPAHAALATVGNGLTTTDLNGVGMSADTLAQALVGTGVSVSNVTFSGNPAQAGTIHLVDPAVVSFNDGVILSSGNIADVVGPNKSEGTTGDFNGAGDTQLDALIANTLTVDPHTYDATSLEFDFVPASNHVYFTYVFGSDEYLEWVNLFNDVFAFYVNGTNCAVTPAAEAVSIDTINSTVNPSLYRDNSYWSPPANPINIESDGLTVEMICSAAVNANQTNHMKLAIADTSDHILDSVVMIKAGSFGTTQPESCNNGTDDNADDLIDDSDPICSGTTTPPPTGSSGIGSGSEAPPFTGNEGNAITLDGAALGWAAAPEGIETTWTVDGINGTTGSCIISTPDPLNAHGRQTITSPGVIPIAHADCPDEGEYVARVEGWDAEGGSAFDMDVDFFVHNAPPQVSIDAQSAPVGVGAGAVPGAPATPGSYTAYVATPFHLSATITDLGQSDTSTCEISWGDGSSGAGTRSGSKCTGTHTYSSTGDVLVSVSATDNAGATSAAAVVVSVLDAPAGPVVTVTPPAAATVVGELATFSITVADASSPGTIFKGRVQVKDEGVVVATKPVVNGIATYRTPKLTAGAHHLSATYLATATATPLDSEVVDHVVDLPDTAVKLTGAPAAPLANVKVVTLVARAAVVKPGKGKVVPGTITFYDGTDALGTVTLVTPAAKLQTTFAAGSHTITAVYNGSATLHASPPSNAVVISAV